MRGSVLKLSLRINLRFKRRVVLQLGTKESPYQKILIWKGSLVVETKELSTIRPKWLSSSLPQFHPPIQVVDVDSSTPVESSPSKTPSSNIPLSKSTASGSS